LPDSAGAICEPGWMDGAPDPGPDGGWSLPEIAQTPASVWSYDEWTSPSGQLPSAQPSAPRFRQRRSPSWPVALGLAAAVGVVGLGGGYALGHRPAATRTAAATESGTTGDQTPSTAAVAAGAASASATTVPPAAPAVPAVPSIPLATLTLTALHGYLPTLDARLTATTLSQQFLNPSLIVNELSTDGFTDGYRRVYRHELPSRFVDAELWRFSSPQGAQDFFDAYYLAEETSRNVRSISNPISVPGSIVVVLSKPDPNGYTVIYGVVQSGTIIAHIRYDELWPGAHQDVLIAALKAQLARLPAG
jgi:hypothetical protein